MNHSGFPGFSENGLWSYDDLVNLGYSSRKLERLGLREGDMVQVQMDENDHPYLLPLRSDQIN